MTRFEQLPPEDQHAELVRMRNLAVDASLHADDLERKARKARRVATARMRHYEDLLRIAQGQMTLPFEESQ